MGPSSFATVLVGQRAMFREGLTRILSAADFRIAATEASVEEIPPTALPHGEPVLLVVDVSSDQGELVRQIELFKRQYPAARIALLADSDRLSHSDIVDVFRAGAHAYFAKPSSGKFIKSLELVMLGEIIMPAAIMSFMLDRHEEATSNDLAKSAEIRKEAEGRHAARLSAREICILRCLIAGESNKVIARNNAIAEATVKVHVKAILRKIRVNNRTQAAIWGVHNDRLFGRTDKHLDSAAHSTTEPSTLPSVVLTRSETPGVGTATLLGPPQQAPKVNGADQGIWSH